MPIFFITLISSALACPRTSLIPTTVHEKFIRPSVKFFLRGHSQMTSSVKGEEFAKDDGRGGLAEDDIIIYHAVLGPAASAVV